MDEKSMLLDSPTDLNYPQFVALLLNEWKGLQGGRIERKIELGFEWKEGEEKETHKEHINSPLKENNFIPYNNMCNYLTILPFIGWRK